jgi:hypothetical protein
VSALSDLESFIAGVETLGKMNQDVAKAAVEPVLEAARATASAGTTPTGEPWAPTKEGGRALPNAAGAITGAAKGTRIDIKIPPPLVYHQFGAGGSSQTKEAKRARARAAKSGTTSKFHAPQRQIIPNQGEPIPEPMKAAIAETAERVFEKAVG